MKTNRHVLAAFLCAILIALAALATAQPAPEATPEDEDTTPTRSMGETINDVFGESGVILDAGEIEQITEQGEVVSVVANDEVVLKSDKINLNSDYLLIDVKGQKILATGNVYLTIQDNTAICGRFEYDIVKKITILRESPRIISSGGASESTKANMSACEIIITEDAAGKTKTVFRPCEGTRSRLQIGGKEEENATKKPETGATAIDPNNPSDVGRVIGEQPAPAETPRTNPAFPIP